MRIGLDLRITSRPRLATRGLSRARHALRRAGLPLAARSAAPPGRLDFDRPRDGRRVAKSGGRDQTACRLANSSTTALERFSQLYSEPIAAMSDVVPTLGRREQCEGRGGERGDVVEGARARGAQERFQFCECHFDRIEVGTVGR